MPPAAATAPLSPQSLGQSFTTGMTTGAPAVTDLLGATTVAAAHHPHGYLSQPDPDTPALTGDRTARIAARIEELGPTLVETVRRRDTLPRIAQAVVVAATRNYGVPDNETDLLR